MGIEPTVEGIEPTHTGENEVVEDHLFLESCGQFYPSLSCTVPNHCPEGCPMNTT